MNDLQVIEVTNEQKALVKQTVFPDATDAELDLFLFDCARRGVHPLDKLLHPTKRNGKYVPITSIDLFRMQAGSTGEHAGTDDAIFTGDGQYPDKATVTVYRMVQGQKFAYTASARWAEYYPGDGKEGFMWRKMPCGQLGKCAEALALRKAFPQLLHGLYTHEEMDQAESQPKVIQPRQEDGAGLTRHEVVDQQASDAPAPSHDDQAQPSYTPPPSVREPYRIKSGKNKGKLITEISRDWLEWAYANAGMPMRKIAEDELTRRALAAKPATPEAFVLSAYGQLTACTTLDALDTCVDRLWSESQPYKLTEAQREEIKNCYDAHRAKLAGF